MFDFLVEYKPGTTNVVADALSGCDSKVESSPAALFAPELSLFDEIRQEQKSNSELQQLREEVNNGSHGENGKWWMVRSPLQERCMFPHVKVATNHSILGS
jgi:hypothetical protein